MVSISPFVIFSAFFIAELGAACAQSSSSSGIELLALPSFYPAETWQGRSQAVIRVLDRRDSEVAVFTLSVGGEAAHYKSLSIRASSCLQRPTGLPEDSAVQLNLEDKIIAGSSAQSLYDGWFFVKEPALNGYISPLYTVSIVGCAGENVAPYLPPLLKKPVPHLTIVEIPQIEADSALLSGKNGDNDQLSKSIALPQSSSQNVSRETSEVSPLAPPLSSDGDESLLPPLSH